MFSLSNFVIFTTGYPKNRNSSSFFKYFFNFVAGLKVARARLKLFFRKLFFKYVSRVVPKYEPLSFCMKNFVKKKMDISNCDINRNIYLELAMLTQGHCWSGAKSASLHNNWLLDDHSWLALNIKHNILFFSIF